MDKLELYYDHYKESCTLSREAQKRRNKSFVMLCCLEAISFLILIRPDIVFSTLLAGISSKLGAVLNLGNSILQTLIWVLLTYILIRYCQDTLYVERQYVYLSKIEKEISNSLEGGPFNRESENYQSNYPIVLNFIDLFYKMLAPIMFFLINVMHIAKEWQSTEIVTLALLCDSVLFFAITIITWFYFFEIHSKIATFCKRIPLIKEIAEFLRKILKEV